MLKDSYKGIEQEYAGFYKKSGSKFYAHIYPITSEEDAKSKINELKLKYSDATHVCPAFIVGIEREIQWFSDDGEPSNSAGRPILNALLSTEASFILAAVVRYYGGKKLGIPGLIESYGAATQDALSKTEFKQLVLKDVIICSMDIAQHYLLYNLLNSIEGVEFSASDSQFKIVCSKSLTSTLREQLLNLPTLAIENEV